MAGRCEETRRGAEGGSDAGILKYGHGPSVKNGPYFCAIENIAVRGTRQCFLNKRYFLEGVARQSPTGREYEKAFIPSLWYGYSIEDKCVQIVRAR